MQFDIVAGVGHDIPGVLATPCRLSSAPLGSTRRDDRWPMLRWQFFAVLPRDHTRCHLLLDRPRSKAATSTRVLEPNSSSVKFQLYFQLQYLTFFFKCQTAIKTGKPLAPKPLLTQ